MRQLSDEEIRILEDRNCWAEDWTNVHVSDDFKPNYMHRVMLYGEVSIGDFDKNIEVSRGFMKHSGINNATLRNVTIETTASLRTLAASLIIIRLVTTVISAT